MITSGTKSPGPAPFVGDRELSEVWPVFPALISAEKMSALMLDASMLDASMFAATVVGSCFRSMAFLEAPSENGALEAQIARSIHR